MTITPSRLLTRLDADIAAATDLVTADCLRAERAAYLARQGHLAEATKEIEAIRSRHTQNPNAAIVAWVSLAEGILKYFENERNPLSRDKLSRAYALGSSVNLTTICVTSLAWLAQLGYAELDFRFLAKNATMGLNIARSSDQAAISRICLVVGQAYHLAGAFWQAEPWYKKSRELALFQGDEPTIVALSHNMAWLHLSDLRRSVLTKNESATLVNIAVRSIESYLSANAILQDGARPELTPTLRAQILSLTGRLDEAIVAHETWLGNSSPLDLGRFSANTKADLAWCYARVGRIELALELARSVICDITERIQIDELAATYSLLNFVFEIADEPSAAAEYGLLSRRAWSKFQIMQDDIKLCLQGMVVPHLLE